MPEAKKTSSTNTYKYGFSHFYVAFQTDEGWEKPEHVPGAINFTADPQGEQNIVYWDNGPGMTQTKNNGYSGSLEDALLPDHILARMNGWYIDKNGKLVEDADGIGEKFAVLFQVEGDKQARRVVWYNCQAARPSATAQTTEASITPNTDTLDLTVTAYYFKDIDKNIVKSTCYKGDSEYDNFFEQVVLPAEEDGE